MSFPLPSCAAIPRSRVSSMRRCPACARARIYPKTVLGLTRSICRGTVFQLRVWQALRQIPRGEETPSQLQRTCAARLAILKATRAVARACASQSRRIAGSVPPGCRRQRFADRLSLGRGA